MDGFWKRLTTALRCFFSILFRGELPHGLPPEWMHPAAPAVTAPSPPAAPPPNPDELAPGFDRAVQMLALLQRDGRLIDFLAEEISPYPDAQLGAAVRQIHAGCRAVLDEYVSLEPVLNAEEDQPVTLPQGFEPASIKLVGNLTGQAPLRGLLRHRGWRVKQLKLPPLPSQGGRALVAPAEVEVP